MSARSRAGSASRSRREARVRAALLVVFLVAGCLERPSGEWRFGGTFSHDYTDADREAVCAAVREHNADCVMMESFPEQYDFRFPSRAECEAAQARVVAVRNTAGVTECQPAP